jgi:thiol-disulfide isomerase/thioredoxin
MKTIRGASRHLFSLAVLLALVATTLAAPSGEREPAPRFNAKTLSGESFNNQSLKGKVVLLQFWTTWCPYCRREQPLIDEVQKDLASKGLIVLAVNVGESKKTVRKYLAEYPRACRVVLNDDTNLPAMFESNGFPLYVVIDRDGNIAGKQEGAAGAAALYRLLSQAGLTSDDEEEDERVPRPATTTT